MQGKKNVQLEARSHEDGILAGAIGAALLGAWRVDQLVKKGRLELLGARAAA